ncbi:TldD/PmbA family protein [Cetobacterium sp.]|uniref:TldD/PmbA family protein n=1 Tax=Cetobacterium sp. TaxID=2071632 RepID=UPI003F2EADB6
MLKDVITRFNCKVVLTKLYDNQVEIPFKKVVSYGTSNSVYDNKKRIYEIDSVNNLNFNYIKSKEIIKSVTLILNDIANKDYEFYESDINNNVNYIKKEFMGNEFIKNLTFCVMIETDARIINQCQSIINDKVEIVTLATVISIIKDNDIITKTLNIMGNLNDGIAILFKKLKNEIYLLLENTIPIDLKDEFELIFSPNAAGTMLHETIGHALEADFFIENKCFLSEYYNCKVFPNKLNLIDGKLFKEFDDEGVLCKDVNLIKNGKLIGLLYNKVLSNLTNEPITGNGFKASCSDFIIPRMRNLKIINGNSKIEDIFKSTKNGIYIKSIQCGDVNLTTGEISLLVEHAYLIKDGKKINKINGFTYYGNAIELIKNIDLIGNNYEKNIIKCGKRGQVLTVGYEVPTIKIKKIKVMRG